MRKRKTIISVFISLVLLSTSLSPAFAATTNVQAQKNVISSSTVITKDNINQVLEYLGIDPKKCIQTNECDPSKNYTVRDVENAMAQAKKEIAQREKNQAASSTFTFLSSKPSRFSSFLSGPNGLVTLNRTCWYTNYNINLQISATYSNYQWGSTSGESATLDDKAPIGSTSHRLNQQTNLVTITDARTTLVLESIDVVTSYFGISYFSIPMATETVHSKGYWYINGDT